MKPYIVAVIITAALLGCGTEKEERTDAQGNQSPDNISSVISDEETSTLAITAQVDEAISAASEDQESESTSGLLLTEADNKKVHTRFRDCNESDGKATVDIKKIIERSFSNEGPLRSVATSFKLLDERTRVWSLTDGQVKCSANKKNAMVPWKSIEGMSTAVTFKSEKSRTSSLTNKKKGTTISTSHSVKVEGERNINWSNIASEDSVIVQKSIVSSVSRELTVNKKNGDTKVLSSTVVIGADAPLVITVERDKTSLDILSRTIKSGKVVATGKEGGRIDTTFEGVKYTKENKCMASEGKISGAIFAKEATEASLTFEITFTGESKTIIYSNGKEVDYSPDGCVFDEPEVLTEKESKDEVAAAEPAE